MEFSLKIKTGIDIIEVNRIKDNIEKNGYAFLNRVFTENEIEYCEGKKVQKFQSYAARFAAKEAVFKAISSFLTNKYDIEWKNIEILNDINGRPFVNMEKLRKLECFSKMNMMKQIELTEKSEQDEIIELREQDEKTELPERTEQNEKIGKNELTQMLEMLEIDISISHIKEMAVASVVVYSLK